MTKLELKSSHEVIYTVDVADVESVFYCKSTDPDILTVLMKDGKRLYCDEVCPLQEEPISEDLEEAAKNHAVERYRATRDMVLAEKCKWSFKAGANWQKEQDKETIELAEDHAMLAGMEKMKEEMMAKATDATVTDIRTYKEENEIDFTIMLEKGIVPYELEDELKVIVIKED